MRVNDSAIGAGSEARPLTGRQAAAWIAVAVEVGIDHDRRGLEFMAATAVANGAPPLLVAVACDECEPLIARLRALGRIAAYLD